MKVFFNEFAVWYGCDEDWTNDEIVDYFIDEMGVDVSEVVGKEVELIECESINGFVSHYFDQKIEIEAISSFSRHILYND